MFTWICPQCGREVPPSYDECPDCKERAAQAAQAAQQGQAPPNPQGPPPPPGVPPQAYTPPAYQPPQPAYQPAQPPYQPGYQPPPFQPQAPYQAPQYQPQGPYQPPQPPPPPPQMPPQPQLFVRAYTAPPAASGLPVWLLTILFALAVLGVVAGVVWTVGYFHNRPETKPSAAVESPAAKPGAATHPLQKYIEISGVRFEEDPKHKDKTLARFILTNHSDAEITGLAGNVTVWASTRKSEEDAQGTITFAADLKPMESKELTSPLNTKLKIYELPDWQNVTTDVQITAPRAQ